MLNKEGNLDEFIDVIILNPPKDKNTIQLQFDNININDLFDNLLYIFTTICKKKYDNDNGKVDIDKLEHREIHELICYFQSFGINLILSIYNIEDYKNYSDYLDADELFFCNAKKLSDLIYKIIIKKKILIIKFDFL
jgi:hypothetical protein